MTKEIQTELKRYNKIEDTLFFRFIDGGSLAHKSPSGWENGRWEGTTKVVGLKIDNNKIKIEMSRGNYFIEFDNVNSIEEYTDPQSKSDVGVTIFKGVKKAHYVFTQPTNDDPIIYEDQKGFDFEIHWHSNKLRKFLCWPEQKYQYTGTLQSISETLFMKYLSDMWLGVCTPNGWSDKKGKLPYTGIKVRIEDNVVKIINWYHFEIQIIGATTFKEEIDSTQDQQKLIFYDVKKVAMYDLEKKIRVKSPYYEDLKGFTLILFWNSPEYKNNFYRPTE